MKQPGRPSKEEEDHRQVYEMIMFWHTSQRKCSARQLSRFAVGLDVAPLQFRHVPKQKNHEQATDGEQAGKNEQNKEDQSKRSKLESDAKRLERRFLKLKKSGDALAISVYLERNKERIILRNHHSDKSIKWQEKEATRRAAEEFGLKDPDVVRLAKEGWDILDRWNVERFTPVNQ